MILRFPATPTTIYPTQEPSAVLNYIGVADNSFFPLTVNPLMHSCPWNPSTIGVPLSMSQFSSLRFPPSFEGMPYYPYPCQMPMFQPMYEVPINNYPMDHHSYRSNIYHHQSYDPYDAGGYNRKATECIGAYQAYPGCTKQRNIIIIQKLHRNTSPRMIRDHFHNAGFIIERCETAPADDRTFGRWRQPSSATVTFRSEEEAERAVTLFDQSLFMGTRIRVRLDGWGDAECSSSSTSTGAMWSDAASHHSKSKSTSTSPSISPGSADFDDNEIGTTDATPGSAVGKSSNTTTCISSDPPRPLVVNGSNLCATKTEIE